MTEGQGASANSAGSETNKNFAREIEEIAQKLGALLATSTPARSDIDSYLNQELARRKARRKLGGPFRPKGIAWDVLIYLLKSGREGRPVSVCDAVLMAEAPRTTALRAVQELEAAGFIKRFADPHDMRRFYLHLRPQASSAVMAALATD
ncbi:hypothetical protein ACSMXM_10885 [Pacificimonas sp. ICDLI1SI03]